MKVVVGVDLLSQGDLVLKVLDDLKFRSLQLRLAHVLEVWDGSGFSGVDASPFLLENFLKPLEDEARGVLADLYAAAQRRHMDDVSTVLLQGYIVNQLLDYVDRQRSDLLALGSYGKNSLESFVDGSVGRKSVIHCHKSVLIAKDHYGSEGELSVVLATDHSPESHRWIETFLGWAPQGIKRLTLLSVIPNQVVEAGRLAGGHMDVAQWLSHGLAEQNRLLLRKFAPLGMECSSQVAVGDVGDSIARVMEETKSKLLVVGAQGHGFMERMLIGSVSYEQAMKRPYSVLIVRP